MLDCISVQNMRDSDNYTIANFVSSLELMHRAAYGVYLSGQWQGSTAIVVGSGNNGGDGYALSCILAENGLNCTVFPSARSFLPTAPTIAPRQKR